MEWRLIENNLCYSLVLNYIIHTFTPMAYNTNNIDEDPLIDLAIAIILVSIVIFSAYMYTHGHK